MSDGKIHIEELSVAYGRQTVLRNISLQIPAHGIFAIRSPHRPNHIGVSVVRILRIAGNRLHFAYVDMLDGTPLLDIKPYVNHFDWIAEARCGWLEKHFHGGKTPRGAARKKG